MSELLFNIISIVFIGILGCGGLATIIGIIVIIKEFIKELIE